MSQIKVKNKKIAPPCCMFLLDCNRKHMNF